MRIDVPVATLEALKETADLERRDLRDQAEHLIIRALHRRGLVTADGVLRRKRLYPEQSADGQP
jgi:hypothetical protein